jgi:hypothetical protein
MDENDAGEIDFTANQEDIEYYQMVKQSYLNCLDDDLKELYDGLMETSLNIQIVRLLREILKKIG